MSLAQESAGCNCAIDQPLPCLKTWKDPLLSYFKLLQNSLCGNYKTKVPRCHSSYWQISSYWPLKLTHKDPSHQVALMLQNCLTSLPTTSQRKLSALEGLLLVQQGHAGHIPVLTTNTSCDITSSQGQVTGPQPQRVHMACISEKGKSQRILELCCYREAIFKREQR